MILEKLLKIIDETQIEFPHNKWEFIQKSGYLPHWIFTKNDRNFMIIQHSKSAKPAFKFYTKTISSLWGDNKFESKHLNIADVMQEADQYIKAHYV